MTRFKESRINFGFIIPLKKAKGEERGNGFRMSESQDGHAVGRQLHV